MILHEHLNKNKLLFQQEFRTWFTVWKAKPGKDKNYKSQYNQTVIELQVFAFGPTLPVGFLIFKAALYIKACLCSSEIFNLRRLEVYFEAKKAERGREVFEII